MSIQSLILAAALACGACSRNDTAPSAEQNRDMDRAAEMLNGAQNNLDDIDDSALLQEQENLEAVQD